MPIKKGPKCTQITIKIGLKMNLGNYEDISLEFGEAYSLDDSDQTENTRRVLMSNLMKFLRTETARVMEPMVLTDTGKSPAGQLAIYMKESKDR